jgi:hypothetical protein
MEHRQKIQSQAQVASLARSTGTLEKVNKAGYPKVSKIHEYK